MKGMLKFISMAIFAAAILFIVPRAAFAITYEVEIENYAYNPGGMHINPGDAIEWRNRDAVQHSATSDDGIWDSGLLSENQTYTYTFSLAGVYPYHCSLHSFMMDTIFVEGATGIGDQPSQIPDDFEMAQNYPNPFNAQTEIQYSLPRDSHVKIVIYNMLGQITENLVDEEQSAGVHDVIWDASHVPTGVYFYRIVASEFTQTRKMLLMK